MREKNPFNQKVQLFDKLHGVPGANEVLKNKFLEYVQKAAKNKTYFSNTTYSIIYKLIKTDKIGLFFTPSVKIKNFFVSDEPIQISGGYDFNKRRIEIYVSWKFGYDTIFQILKSYMSLLCNKIFATILSEALIIYDYKHNGELSKHDKIRQWYYEYFRGVFGDILKQQDLSNKLADIVSQNYGTRMYNRIENALIEGTSPEIKMIKKGENPELDIEGIPLIKKNEKELHDIFSDAIEDYVNEYMNDLGINNHAGSEYKRIREMFDEFGNFGEFLYKNRDLELNPKNIKENPEDDSLPIDKKAEKESANLMKYKMEKEAEAKEEKAYQKYLKNNPKIKALLDKSQNSYLDQITEKYFGSLIRNAKEFNMIEKKYPDGTVKMIPQRSTNQAQSVRSYIDSKNNEDYISLFLLGKSCNINDMQDAVDGTEKNLDCYIKSQNRLNEAIRNGDSEEQIRKLREMTEIYEKQFKVSYPHLIQLFVEKTRGTINRDEFYKPISSGDKASNSVEDDFLNAKDYINKMKKLIDKQKNSNLDNSTIGRLVGINGRSKLNIKQSSDILSNDINQLKTLDAIIISDASTTAQKQDALNKFKEYCNNIIKKDIGDIGNKLTDTSKSNLKFSDALNFRPKDRKLNNIIQNIQNEIDQLKSSKIVSSIDSGLFGNSSYHTLLNKMQNIKKYFIDNNIDKVANDISTILLSAASFGYRINKDINNKILDGNKELSSTGRSLKNMANQLTIPGFKKFIGDNSLKLNNDGIKNILNDNSKRNMFLSKVESFINNINLTKNYIEDETRKIYSTIDPKITRSTNIETLKKFGNQQLTNDRIDKLQKRINKLKTFMNSNSNDAINAIKKQLEKNGKNTDIVDIINGELILNDYSNSKDRKNAIRLIEKMLKITNQEALPGETHLVLGNKSLLDRADNPEKDYYKLLFLNGLNYLRDCLPSWDTIVDHFKQGYSSAKHVADVVKSIYRTVKVILPLKSNIYPYMNQKFGFENMGDLEYFDLAYKLSFGVKKMYKLRKYSVRHNMIYSEIFLPVSIFCKVLFTNITTQNDYDNIMLYLINCANKGLEEFI